VPFAFENCVLDPDRRELARDGRLVPIPPQVFDLLLHLVQNREHVVSKNGLLDAVWGRRIVSDSTLASHINAVRKAIGDSGEQQRLLKTVPRKGFRFVAEVREGDSPLEFGQSVPESAAPPASSLPRAAPPTLPDRPSIAALPFVNLSGDPEQAYFADGVVEDIITALSRIRWLFVIGRNSSFTYKDRVIDVKQVGRELGVRYVLEGSVRRSANRVRITGQLIDAETGVNIWADRFEGTLDDIFDLQDHIATSVVGAISPQLERAEIERSWRKPTGSLDAYDHYLRGMAHVHAGTREAIQHALAEFLKALRLDSDFASANAMAAWCQVWRKLNGWLGDPEQDIAEGIRLARRAVELGKDDAVALTRGGHALAILAGELDRSVALLDQALVLNPNLASAWFLGGYLRALQGDTDAAIVYFTHAMQLSPLDPETYRMQAGMALAHLFAGRFDEASAWSEKALAYLPAFLPAAAFAAASHALSGRTTEAHRALDHTRRLDPSLRASQLQGWLPIHRAQDRETLAAGLRAAGLPD
jgi:TolB-like protein/Flp pilus assembly protein TadD